MRLIFTSDWHLGAGHSGRWPVDLAQRRRLERARAIRWIIEYARSSAAQFLVVVGDVCDEKEPDEFLELRDELLAMESSGCTPLMFFNTHGRHDRPRDWWSGPQLGPQPDRRPDVGGRPLSGTYKARGLLFSAHDHLPAPSDLPTPASDAVARIVLLHGSIPVNRVESLRGHVSLVVGGHNHAHRVLSSDFAFRAGSPMFRDLSSFDPGPRHIADATLDATGHVTSLTFPEVPTELSVKARFEDGTFTAVNPRLELTTDPVEGLRQLVETYAYVGVRVSAQEVAELGRCVHAAGGLRIRRWTRQAGRELVLVTQTWQEDSE